MVANPFYGTYAYTLDDKGRLRVPSKLRECISQSPSDPLIITQGLDQCLFVYPLEEWKSIVVKLAEPSFTKSNSRRFNRMFFAGASECPIDNAGRIAVPQVLRDYAGILREVIIIGVYNRIEIWAKEVWESYRDESRKCFEEIAEQLL